MTLEVLEKRVHMAMEATTGSRLEYRRPVGKSTFTEWMPVNEARLFDVLMEDDVELRRGPAQHACPFCGTEHWGHYRMVGSKYAASCEHCKCAGPSADTVERAFKEWDNRAKLC